MTTMFESEVRFRELMLAVPSRDPDRAAAFFAEDATLKDFSNPSVVHTGRAQIREVIAQLMETFDDLTMTVVDLVASEDRLATELIVRGTPVGQTEPIQMEYCGFYTFGDGLFLSEHLYTDSAQLPSEP